MERIGFYDKNLSNEQLRNGIVTAGISMSSAAVAVGSLIFYRPKSIDWKYIFVGIGLLFITGVFLAIKYLLFSKSHKIVLDPYTSAGLLTVSTIAIGFLIVGEGLKNGAFIPSFFMITIVVGIIGNITMRMWVWGIVSVVAFATEWKLIPTHDGSFYTLVIFLTTTLFLSQSMVGMIMRNLAGRNSCRIASNLIAEAANDVDSFEEAFKLSLPLINKIIPTEHAYVFQRFDSSETFKIMSDYHFGDSVELGNEDSNEVLSVAETLKIRVTPNLCFIPLGISEAGELVLVLSRLKSRGYANRYPEEACFILANGYLRLLSHITYLRSLKQETLTDPLTGLANRRSWSARLDVEVARAKRGKTQLSHIMIDLDHFKDFNDAYGHQAGDQFLRSFAALVSSRIRSQDLAARYGGEEFSLILPETDMHGALELAFELNNNVKEINAPTQMTISAGVSTLLENDSSDELVRRSDESLYKAKNSGRDRVESQAINGKCKS